MNTHEEVTAGAFDQQAREVSDPDPVVLESALGGDVVERKLEQGAVERVTVEGEDSGEVEILPDGSVSIPLVEEQVVLTKRVIVRQRIIVRKTALTQTPSGLDLVRRLELEE